MHLEWSGFQWWRHHLHCSTLELSTWECGMSRQHATQLKHMATLQGLLQFALLSLALGKLIKFVAFISVYTFRRHSKLLNNYTMHLQNAPCNRGISECSVKLLVRI